MYCQLCGKNVVAGARGQNQAQAVQSQSARPLPKPAVGILEPSRHSKNGQQLSSTSVRLSNPAKSSAAAPMSGSPGISESASKPSRSVLVMLAVLILLVAAVGIGMALQSESPRADALRAERKNPPKQEAPPEAPITKKVSALPPDAAPKPASVAANSGEARPRPHPASPPSAAPEQRPTPPTDKPPEKPEEKQPQPAQNVAAKAPVRLPAGLDQKAIDDAIARGVKYLKKEQPGVGTWNTRNHSIGYAALPGLTLLECGVPAGDAYVQAAAKYVRANAQHLVMHSGPTDTYEVSLAVLFLDRLGDARDKALIQAMALRLVSGQTERGGWSYQLPVLRPDQAELLLAFLQSTRPKQPAPLEKPKDLQNPLPKPATDPTGKDSGNKSTLPGSASPGIIPFNPDGPPKDKPPAEKGAGKVKGKGPAQSKRPPNLPPDLRGLPALQPLPNRISTEPGTDNPGDNSNTQFAILALWVARRHDVPTEKSLQLAYKRFVSSQDERKGWGYTIFSPEDGRRKAMVGVGLLGLAMGHGSSEELPKNDPKIESGLRVLARHIGMPRDFFGKPPMEDVYFLWTLERVAMLYNLETIGGKDWYGWGAQLLVANQLADGHWRSAHYPGASETIDTCFALLFLRRSNLVQDLTDRLQLQMAITDPQNKK